MQNHGVFHIFHQASSKPIKETCIDSGLRNPQMAVSGDQKSLLVLGELGDAQIYKISESQMAGRLTDGLFRMVKIQEKEEEKKLTNKKPIIKGLSFKYYFNLDTEFKAHSIELHEEQQILTCLPFGLQSFLTCTNTGQIKVWA